MKILVPVKRVIDPNIPVRLEADGFQVVHGNIPHALNPFDEVALAKAAEWRASNIASELIALSIGPGNASDTLRSALAMGADRAIHIVTRDTTCPISFDIARIIGQVCKDEQPDLVIMGKQAIDSDAGQTPALLAGLLDLPYLPEACEIEFEDGLVFTRFDQNGNECRAKAALPAIVSCELHLIDPRPIGLAQMMKAKHKTVVSQSLEDFGMEQTESVHVIKRSEPAPRPPCTLFDTPQELAAKLKSDGFLS